jgi:hypothetical protein
MRYPTLELSLNYGQVAVADFLFRPPSWITSRGMARLIAFLIASTFLSSCSNVSGGMVGDYAPTWLGGAPKDLPPRPGTPDSPTIHIAPCPACADYLVEAA